MTNKDAQQVLDVLKEAQRIADTNDIPEADKAWRISAVLNGGIQPAQRLAEGEKALTIAFRFIQAVAMSPNGTEFKYTAQDALKEITDITAGCWKPTPPTPSEE